jgi:hypothetical protein
MGISRVITSTDHFFNALLTSGQPVRISFSFLQRWHRKTSMSCMKKIDITGQRFGRLVAVRYETTTNRVRLWLCKCDCGKEVTVRVAALKNGNTRSCGCLKNEATSQLLTKHKDKGTKEYTAWMHMRRRCNNHASKYYYNYGGRGIRVCEEWDNYLIFLRDVGRAPSKDYSLDRIDVNGNYEPGNVRWATRKEQNNNKRNSIRITINGETKTLQEWCDLFGVNRGTAKYRYKMNMPVELIFSRESLRNANKNFDDL